MDEMFYRLAGHSEVGAGVHERHEGPDHGQQRNGKHSEEMHDDEVVQHQLGEKLVNRAHEEESHRVKGHLTKQILVTWHGNKSQRELNDGMEDMSPGVLRLREQSCQRRCEHDSRSDKECRGKNRNCQRCHGNLRIAGRQQGGGSKINSRMRVRSQTPHGEISRLWASCCRLGKDLGWCDFLLLDPSICVCRKRPACQKRRRNGLGWKNSPRPDHPLGHPGRQTRHTSKHPVLLFLMTHTHFYMP